VLLPLNRGYPADRGLDTAFASIRYGDARSWIGKSTNRTHATLESVVLSAVRFDCPPATGDGSVVAVVRELFGALDMTLYTHGAAVSLTKLVTVVQSDGTAGSRFDQLPNLERIGEAMALWQQDENFREVRATVDRLPRTSDGSDTARTLPFLGFTLDLLGRMASRGAQESATPPLGRFPDPMITVGPSHGDLHGRNILVGVTEERVDRRWLGAPTVYDYGNMGDQNLVALDFVKLETELKVRAYDFLFACDPENSTAFAQNVTRVEERLANDTQEYAKSQRLPDSTTDTPEARLRALVFEIRKQAFERMRGGARWRDWLDEYYLCLAAYSILPARFDDYQRRLTHRLAVAAAGDVAAGRVAWVITRRVLEWRAVDDIAGRADIAAAEGEATANYLRGLFGSDAVLELTRRWWKSGDGPHREAACRLLDLVNRLSLPNQDLWQQHILLLMDTDPATAEELIAQAERRFACPNEEMGCRFGRVRKELGDRLRLAGDPTSARTQYLLAIENYQRGYDERRGQYPGVNIAALHLLVAATYPPGHREQDNEMRKSTAFAKQLLADRTAWWADQPEPRHDSAVWHRATLADLHLLSREWEAAATEYRAIPASLGQVRAIARQVRRIVDAWLALGEEVPEPFRSFCPTEPGPLFVSHTQAREG
jgi:hypothetical protein